MERKLWKKFDQLTEKCYDDMAGIKENAGCWQQAFETLQEIVKNERANDKNFARELYLLDDMTDYVYDVGGWLEDYLDELDMREEYETLLQSCDWLLQNFDWTEGSATDICFAKSTTLAYLGKTQEADAFCEAWMKKEPDNPYAAAAGVYAKMGVRDFAAAEEIVEKRIGENTVCDEENDVIFIAAEQLYKRTENKKKLKWIQKKLEIYEENLKNFMMGLDDEDDDLYDDWDLPFN